MVAAPEFNFLPPVYSRQRASKCWAWRCSTGELAQVEQDFTAWAFLHLLLKPYLKSTAVLTIKQGHPMTALVTLTHRWHPDTLAQHRGKVLLVVNVASR